VAPCLSFGIIYLNFANGLVSVLLGPRNVTPNTADFGVRILSPDDARQTRAAVQD
jgi:hypothetical protein